MEIKFDKTELVDIINEDIDRLAARSFNEEGGSLFDSIRIKSRDAGVQGRMLEERDAKLRELLAFCLGSRETEDIKDDKGMVTGVSLVYDVMEENCSKVPCASSLRVLLRKYLTESVLYDWYTKHGIASSFTYDYIEALESKIVCTLRSGYTKKPLQPWGPRN